jgi:hypothetical protein
VRREAGRPLRWCIGSRWARREFEPRARTLQCSSRCVEVPVPRGVAQTTSVAPTATPCVADGASGRPVARERLGGRLECERRAVRGSGRSAIARPTRAVRACQTSAPSEARGEISSLSSVDGRALGWPSRKGRVKVGRHRVSIGSLVRMSGRGYHSIKSVARLRFAVVDRLQTRQLRLAVAIEQPAARPTGGSISARCRRSATRMRPRRVTVQTKQVIPDHPLGAVNVCNDATPAS